MENLFSTVFFAISLSINDNLICKERQEQPRKRNSNLKEVNQLETLDEVSDESSRTTPSATPLAEPHTAVERTSPCHE